MIFAFQTATAKTKCPICFKIIKAYQVGIEVDVKDTEKGLIRNLKEHLSMCENRIIKYNNKPIISK